MTPDELRELCNSAISPKEFAAAVSQLDETQRKKLSSTAQKIAKASIADEENTAHQWAESSSLEEKQELSKRHDECEAIKYLCHLSIFAFGPVSQVMTAHRNLRQTPEIVEALVQILKDRQPEWADAWINNLLEKEGDGWGFFLKYEHIRTLIETGVIQRPTCDAYIRMVGHPERTDIDPANSPELMSDEIWRLFEVETDALLSLPNPKEVDRDSWTASIDADADDRNKFDWPYTNGGWPRVLFFHSEQGTIDRGRLIDATLASFWRGFRIPVARGLLRFHDLLAPTVDEIADREATYRELLRCDNGQVVALALKALGRLDKAKRLDVVPFLQEVPTAFAISTKAQPKVALALVDRVTKRTSEHRNAGLAAIHSALGHEHPDIQEQALKLAETWKADNPAFDLSSLLNFANNVAPQHRNRLEAIAGMATDSVATADNTVSLEEREQAVRKRFTALPDQFRRVTCSEGMVDALSRGELPPPFAPPPECPVLSGIEPIDPIGDVDELIDAVGRLMESMESADEVERVIDGIVRLGGESTEEFDKKTAPLRKLKITASSWSPTAIKTIDLICRNLLRLIETWLGNEFAREETLIMLSINSPALSPLMARAEALCERVKNRQFGPTLAAPTHSGGWIDPRVFVARLMELQTREISVDRADFIGGLLRLAPDFRDVALQQAADLAEPQRRIVCFALGGNEQPSRDDSDLAEEWLAAGRSRNPYGVLDELQILQSSAVNESDPNSILPASYAWSPLPINNDLDAMAMRRSEKCYVNLVPGPRIDNNIALRPATAVTTPLTDWSWQMLMPGWIPQLYTSQWPANAQATLAAGCCGLTSLHIEKKQFGGWPIADSLFPLLAVDQPWTKLARTTLWLALLSDDEPARRITIDALIEGIADGRAGAVELGDTLVEVAQGGWTKLNRLADALREVTKTSLLAERVVAEILNRLIASWQGLPRDGYQVLSLQLELLASLQSELSPHAKTFLAGVKGSGKAAKLARQLCALKAVAASPQMRLAALEAAEGRLARAERISDDLHQSLL